MWSLKVRRRGCDVQTSARLCACDTSIAVVVGNDISQSWDVPTQTWVRIPILWRCAYYMLMTCAGFWKKQRTRTSGCWKSTAVRQRLLGFSAWCTIFQTGCMMQSSNTTRSTGLVCSILDHAHHSCTIVGTLDQPPRRACPRSSQPRARSNPRRGHVWEERSPGWRSRVGSADEGARGQREEGKDEARHYYIADRRLKSRDGLRV